MNLRWIVLFAAVAKDKSFTAAAARLNVAQPWISAQIRKLETEIGFQLFHRIKNRIELTEEGERLFPIAFDLAEASEQFRNAARQMDAGRGSIVRLGSDMPAIAVPGLAALNDAFSISHQRFAVDMESGPNPWVLEQLRGGLFDLACVMGPFDERGLDLLLVERSRPYLLCPASGRWTVETDTLSLPSLKGEQIGMMPTYVHPALHGLFAQPLSEAGATIVSVPEPQGGAMAHFVRTTGIPVLMIENSQSVESVPGAVIARSIGKELPDIDHFLVRLSSSVPQRGAERYWSLAEQLFDAAAGGEEARQEEAVL